MTLRHLDLFSGIGGFNTAGFVEIDPFCRRVLAKNFPGVSIHEDIRHVGRHNLPPIDIITGGWPCQPFSLTP